MMAAVTITEEHGVYTITIDPQEWLRVKIYRHLDDPFVTLQGVSFDKEGNYDRERPKVTEYTYSHLEIGTTLHIDVYDGNGVRLISDAIYTIDEDGLLIEEEVHGGNSYDRVGRVTIDPPETRKCRKCVGYHPFEMGEWYCPLDGLTKNISNYLATYKDGHFFCKHHGDLSEHDTAIEQQTVLYSGKDQLDGYLCMSCMMDEPSKDEEE